ncbi:MAG: tol-pal system YbgF family protein [Nitrospinaceae bacterium]
MLVFAISASPVDARIVDDVEVRSRAKGYEIRIKFILPLRYVKHRPRKEGDVLLVEMRPVSGLTLENPELLKELGERETLSWNRSVPIPLKEILYETGAPDRPKLVFRFSRRVKFRLRSSADLRTLIVTVLTGKKAKTSLQQAPPGKSAPSLPETSTKDGLGPVIEEANRAMTDGDYPRAIRLYTKILQNPNTKYGRDAQEFLGLARERNHQLAHAKAEYEEYLRRYPEGPGADRVRQRLNGLLTARAQPKEKLRSSKRSGGSDISGWETDLFGSFSQFYNRDVTDSNNGESTVNRSDLTSDLDFNTRWRKGSYDIRTQFVGIHEADFRDNGDGSQTRISALSIEGKDSQRGIRGRLGRQFQSTGGILGRFDGGVFSYDLQPRVKINGVFGFPVEFSTSDAVDTHKHFVGLNFDLGTFHDSVDFNVFAINQRVNGINDRRALGGEIRYFEKNRSMLTLVDYDIDYSTLNLFIFSGDLVYPEKTRWHVSLDYRKSPLLTTSNALQGQGVNLISDLLHLFSEDEVRQLARDRTATSKSLTLGITQDLSEKYQINGEFTVSNISGTPASGGVDATSGTGAEFFYLAQLISSNLLKRGDITIIALRYSDLSLTDNYSMVLNTRFPITEKFRVNPRVRLDFRKNKGNDGNRWTFRPLLKLDYRWKKWLRFEVEGGREWIDETVLGDSQKTTSYFLSAGFRTFF